jgi:DeoR/GlpR family transcriptional regulator of sugar metabolism
MLMLSIYAGQTFQLTIRKDLNFLENEKLHRTHGGASKQQFYAFEEMQMMGGPTE